MTYHETEVDFQSWVIACAWSYGWLVHHSRPAITQNGWRTAIQGNKGFPDLVLARRGKIILAELKSDTGDLSLYQRMWQKETNFEVWRPCDREKIERLLR